MSEEEMCDALDHAAASGAIQFSAFSHSFELLSRDRAVPNRLAIARMEALCRAVAADPRVTNGGFADLPQPPAQPGPIRRSEEHTSELQSLMRISYAVFCLQKKKQTREHKHICN